MGLHAENGSAGRVRDPLECPGGRNPAVSQKAVLPVICDASHTPNKAESPLDRMG